MDNPNDQPQPQEQFNLRQLQISNNTENDGQEQQSQQLESPYRELTKKCIQQSMEAKEALETITETKNIPTTIGKHFRKYLLTLKLKNKEENYALLKFVNKKEVKHKIKKTNKKKQKIKPENEEKEQEKKKKKQLSYRLEDIQEILFDKKGNEEFFHFIQNVFPIRIEQSNKIEDPREFAIYIEQYTAGAQNPEKFITSRHHSQM